MSFRICVFMVVVPTVLGLGFSGCATGPYAQSGTLGGGLAGGAIGALAGVRSDRALEGAAIGAVTGGLIGNATGGIADEQAAYANNQQAAFVQQARSQAVTPDQVIQLAQSGVNDQLIINQLRNNGALSALTTNDMIALKQYGVSDNVITAWQQTPVAGTAARVARVQPIVVQPVYNDFQYVPARRRRPYHGPPCRY